MYQPQSALHYYLLLHCIIIVDLLTRKQGLNDVADCSMANFNHLFYFMVV